MNWIRLNRSLTVLLPICITAFCPNAARAGEGEPEPSAESMRLMRDYLRHLRSTTWVSGERSGSDRKWRGRVRDHILTVEEAGLVAMERAANRGRGHKPDDRYEAYWNTYALSGCVDIPEAGRPRVARFLADPAVPVIVKFWIIDSPAPVEPAEWVPEEALLNMLDELFKIDEVIGVRWPEPELGDMCRLVRFRNGKPVSEEEVSVDELPGLGFTVHDALRWSVAQRDKDGKGHLVASISRGTKGGRIDMRGGDVAANFINCWYGSEEVYWPDEVDGGDKLKAERAKAVEAAKQWVRNRRIRNKVKEGLFLLLENRRAVGLKEGERLQEACRLTRAFIGKRNRGDLWRLMDAYMREVETLKQGRRADATAQAFLRTLGGLIAGLIREAGGICPDPTGRRISDPAQAKAWLGEAIKSCMRPELDQDWHQRREWELMRMRLMTRPRQEARANRAP